MADELAVERRAGADGEDEDDEEDAAGDRDAIAPQAAPGERPLPLRAGRLRAVVVVAREHRRA